MTNATRSRLVTARWALISKEPGTGLDYGVLAASDASAGEMAWEYAAGHPGCDAAPGDPWVTFGTHLDAGDRLVSLAVQRAEAGSDQAGRPIWSRDFFAFRWQDTVQCGVSYRGLYEAAVAAADEDRMADAPVSLELWPQQLGALVATIREFGFERLAGIAAALLGGPVAVGGAAGLRLAERLRLLDAIAALLPYGFRSDLSASSAVSTIGVPATRLILADARHDTHQAVTLDAPAPSPASALASTYLGMLRRKADSAGMETVVRHLWADQGTRSLARAEDAIPSLERLDAKPGLIGTIRDARRIDLETALEFFAEPGDFVARNWPLLPDRCRDGLLAVLLESGGEAAQGVLLGSWSTVLPDVAGLANDRLDHGRPEFAERSLAVAASAPDAGPVDELLAQLLVPAGPPGRGRTSWQERMRARVGLLLSRPVPRPDSLARTRAVLRWGESADWQARLLSALLSSELERDRGTGGSRVAAWASWFSEPAVPPSEGRPDWLAALDFAVAGSGPGGAEAGRVVQSVAAQAPGWTPLLIWLARQSGRTVEILAALRLEPGPEMVRRVLETTAPGGGAAPDAAAFRQAATAALSVPLRSSGIPEESLACADAARVIVDAEPCDFPQAGSEEQVSQYLAGLRGVFESLADVPGWPERIQDGFLACAVPAAAQGPLPRGVVELIKSWSADAARAPGLVRYIAASGDDALVKTLLRYGQLSPQDWSALAAYEPRLPGLAPAARLLAAVQRVIADPGRGLARQTAGFVDDSGTSQLTVPVSGLAAAMYEARRDGMEIPQILEVISGARLPGRDTTLMDQVEPDALWEVLLQFQSLLLRQPSAGAGNAAGTKPADPALELTECADRIVEAGALGTEYARTFRDMLAHRRGEGRPSYLGLAIWRHPFGRSKPGPHSPDRHEPGAGS